MNVLDIFNMHNFFYILFSSKILIKSNKYLQPLLNNNEQNIFEEYIRYFLAILFNSFLE